jgi:enoyl-CoA hydratase/carnithine racemase
MRPGDGRAVRGHRVLFDRETQGAAWYLALTAKRLSPERCRQLQLLAECFLQEDAITAMEETR